MDRPAQSFRDLIVWQKAHEFVLRAYELTKQFPTEEQYCLIPHLRRAAISVPANIAEGLMCADASLPSMLPLARRLTDS